jgi:hypothetical protein
MPKTKLSGLAYYRAVIAKWIIVHIAARISPLAVLSFCIETAQLYHESIEVNEE